jgi:hypothetical protein
MIDDRCSISFVTLRRVDLPELKPMEHNMGKTISGPDIMNIVRARVYGAETGEAARPAGVRWVGLSVMDCY